jgi:hypothetical protein
MARTVNLTVIDDSGVTGWLRGATRIGEIAASGFSDMVQQVRDTVGYGEEPLIHRLDVLTHGSTEHIQLGGDSLSVDTFSTYEPYLRMLQGWFEEEGFVLFSACNIGQNRVLMLALAKALKTTVYAGTGKSYSTLGYWNTGEYAYAMPQGWYQVGVPRP